MGTEQVQPVAVAQVPPVGAVHVFVPQHGWVGEHCWPANEHVLLPMSGLVVPPSGGDEVGLPQTPAVWPGGMMHTLPLPGQQSAVAVHLPAVGTQALPPQTYLPVLSGTQTLPQQSAEVAQAPPAATQPETVKQRGTPTESTRQVILFAPVVPQQLALTPLTEQPLGNGLHVSPAGQLSQQMPLESTSWQWQTSPSGMQVPCVQLDPCGAWHVPRPRFESKIMHLTSPSPGSVHIEAEAPPQQSASWRHRSPWMRQPPAGWQTVEPVLPYSPQ
jgi:hypothetical protein